MNELTKIFLSGYPLAYNEMQLAQLIARYGEIVTITIVRDKISGKPKGFSFIELSSRKAAEDVMVALDGMEIQGNALRVNIVNEKPAKVYRKVERNPGPFKPKRPRLRR